VPDDATEDELRAAAAAAPAGGDPSLLYDTRRHAVLRARLVQNRTALNAVRNARRADEPGVVLHCQQCLQHPTPRETARHAVCECPAYAERRAALVRRLRGAMAAVRERAAQNALLRRVLTSSDELLFHTVCATPFVLATLRSDAARRRLCRITGAFLETIAAARGVW
jgi:hypothetical protein